MDNLTFDKYTFATDELSGKEFSECTFSNCNFSGMRLSGSVFMECRFENCNLSLCQVVGTGFQQVHFSDCKLSRCGLYRQQGFPLFGTIQPLCHRICLILPKKDEKIPLLGLPHL